MPADGTNLRKALEGAEQLISFKTMTSDEFYFAVNLSPDFFTSEEVGSIFTKLKHGQIVLSNIESGVKLTIVPSSFNSSNNNLFATRTSFPIATTGTSPAQQFKFNIATSAAGESTISSTVLTKKEENET